MSSIPRDALNTRASKSGVIMVASSTLKALARATTSCGSENIRGRNLVHHFVGGKAQHPLGPDIEQLNDALLVGGDARKVGTVENRVLQSPRFEQTRSTTPLSE